MPEWKKLPLSLAELCIDTTLRCGQSFRWRRINDEWHCVLQGKLISLKQDPTHLHYKLASPRKLPTSERKSAEDDCVLSLLNRYFVLSQSLSNMYQQWAASDANFARRATAFAGIRILNQDAWETLVSFICSSNNNISRITQMVQKLCVHYGPYVGDIEGEKFHDFPRPEALAGSGVESHLRELGFGYRARFIAETARIVSTDRPAGWLHGLRNPDCPALEISNNKLEDTETKTDTKPPTYRAAHEALLELPGVGPKVSDCVCLMGLGWWESVPVDTHVWQIAQRDYGFGKGVKTKTLNKAMYDAVGDHFRKIWGPQAGYAQSVLFTANLKSFAEQAAGKTEAAKEEVSVAEVEVKPEESKSDISTTASVRTKKRKAVTVEAAVIKAEEENGVEAGGRRTRSTKRAKISG
ncbi:DNA glycosylase [Podospora aff. communis PSN243]|uniref:DNA-(apurinic or apyrimidinic site) lyase n=1 Tax=Podospora aff. communis PSN243 TaxID=3040156 RepID=A0AAV9GUZ3_9PEZI|nr:DNA glycosylase [Podospora aff. communis PSN243]